MDPIHIADHIFLDPGEVEISFIRASGPGGQNVNKVSSAAQLRFNLARSSSLPEALKQRAAKLAGSRLNSEEDIVITASNFRTQKQNRDDAMDRLVQLLRQAAIVPKRRRATRPTLGSQRRRLESKSKRSAIKSLRTDKPGLD